MRHEEDEVSAALQALRVEDGSHVPVDDPVVAPSHRDPPSGMAGPGAQEGQETAPARSPGEASHLAGGASVAAEMETGAPHLVAEATCLSEGPGGTAGMKAEAPISVAAAACAPERAGAAGGTSAAPSEGGPRGMDQGQEAEKAEGGRVRTGYTSSASSGGEAYRLRGPLASTAVAGLEASLQLLRQAIVWPLQYAQEAARLGLQWPRGILLHGPPGCGKTSLVRAIAAEAGAVVHTVSASSIFGPYQGAVLAL